MSTKEDVLKILEENRGVSISGSTMAAKLGVTRASVWKAAKALESDGYKIDAVTNKGYLLSIENDKISAYSIKKHLKTDCFGNNLYILDSVDSTNNYAKRLAADGAAHGCMVTADMQSAGKGRLGRSFYSPAGAGIYMSIILRPTFGADKALAITSAVSVAVCRALESVAAIDARIKWVNDIYLNGKKLCGILTEAVSDFESGGLEYVVVGIGINVTNDAFPDDISNIATSLSDNSDKKVDRNELIAQVLNEFEMIYNSLDTGAFMDEYRRRSCVIGRQVNATRAGVSREVIVEDIDNDGALIVIDENGQHERINSGEISIRFI